MIFQSNQEVEAAVVEWQKVLRLQDWDIIARIVRARDMFTEDSAASVRWTFQKKMATIVLLDPEDYDPNIAFAQDHEISLVHELLHLHYAGFDNTEQDSLEQMLLEQSIEAISTALVQLKRQNSAPAFDFSGGQQTFAHRKENTELIGYVLGEVDNSTILGIPLSSKDWYYKGADTRPRTLVGQMTREIREQGGEALD